MIRVRKITAKLFSCQTHIATSCVVDLSWENMLLKVSMNYQMYQPTWQEKFTADVTG